MTTITDINHLQLVSNNTRKKSQTRQPETEETLSISSTSTLLTEAEEKAGNTPDVDEARVEEIRQAIQNGEMSINHEKLAQKMLEFELTLFDH